MIFNKSKKDRIGPGIKVEQETQFLCDVNDDHEGWSLGISIVLMFCGVFGILWSFLTNLEIKYANIFFYLLVFVFCVGFSFLYYFRDYYRYTFPVVAVVYFLIILVFYRQLNLGFNKICSEIINQFNINYSGSLVSKMQISEDAYVKEGYFFLIVAAFLLCWVLSTWTVYRPNASRVFLIYTPFLICETLLGKSPRLISIFMMVVCIVGTALVSNINNAYLRKRYLLLSGANVQHNFLEENDAYSNQIKRKVVTYGIVGFLPIFFLVAMLVALPLFGMFKSNDSAIQEYVTNGKVTQAVQAMMTDESNPLAFLFSPKAIGGIGDGSLGNVGTVLSSEETALIINTTDIPEGNIYLRAYIGGEYQHTSWKRDVKEQKFLKSTGVSEYAMDYYTYDKASAMDLLAAQEIAIDNVGATKRYRYLPYVADISPMKSKDKEFFSYYGNSFYLALDNNKTVIESLSKEYEAFELSYRDFAYKEYLQLPDKGLERLIEQCEEQNIDKLEDVKKYVKNTIQKDTTYSLNPGTLPKGKEFTAYFLYEQKKGYCVHYASAATLMFRALGVPARYVMGYYVPQETFVALDNGNYEGVASDNKAHAWVEIYEDGIGWVPFEATPASMYTTPFNIVEEEGKEDVVKEEKEEVKKESKTPVLQIITAILMIIIISLVMIFLWRHISGRIKRSRLIRGKNPNTVAQFSYYYLYQAFLFMGLKKEKPISEEALYSFVQEKVPVVSLEDFIKIREIVLASNYSNEQIQEEEAVFVRNIYYSCCSYFYKNMNKRDKLKFTIIKKFPKEEKKLSYE